MVHITSDASDRFWGSRAAGVLPMARSTGRILVSHRSPRVNESGTWGTFGGRVETDEEPPRAAEREFREETGYGGPLDLVPLYLFMQPTFTYQNYLGLVPEEFTPRLNWEADACRWLTLEELNTLPSRHFGLDALVRESYEDMRRLRKTSVTVKEHFRKSR